MEMELRQDIYSKQLTARCQRNGPPWSAPSRGRFLMQGLFGSKGSGVWASGRSAPGVHFKLGYDPWMVTSSYHGRFLEPVTDAFTSEIARALASVEP
jgi:hypothetical protein